MKSTLIFLSFFLFSCVLQAQTTNPRIKTYTTYTPMNDYGTLIKVQLIKRESGADTLLQETFLVNETGKFFMNEEYQVLTDGGVVEKTTMQNIHSLFPPKNSGVIEKFSLVDNVITQVGSRDYSDVTNWIYLILSLCIPFISIAVFSFIFPRGQYKKLLIFYSCLLLSLVAGTGMFGDLTITICLIFLFSIIALISYFFSSKSGYVMSYVPLSLIAPVLIGTSSFGMSLSKLTLGSGVSLENSCADALVLQYVLFISTTCLLFYVLRFFIFKRKERKELAQATV